MSNEEQKRRLDEFADAGENNLEFRHVKIGSSASPSLLKLPSLPPAKLPGPPKGLLRPPARITEQQKSLTVKKEWTASIAAASWDVCPEELGLVPVDFPLERTHREIHGSDATQVATRISTALQKMSIKVDYDKDEAKCQTSDFVSFRIRLFAGGEGCQPVVVELQRRNGPAMTFMQSCRAILSAAEGSPMECRKKGAARFAPKPVGQMACLKGVALPSEDREKEIAGSVAKVVEMLKDDKSDLNVLGMEKLCHLTDPMKTSRATSTVVAKMVILGGDDDVDIRGEMFSTLSRSTKQSQGAPIAEAGVVGLAHQLRHFALRVIDNCLQLIHLQGVAREQPWVQDTLIPLLVEEIRMAKANPHCAYIATSCLTSLVSGCGVARESVLKHDGAVDALRDASVVGREYHELLASETSRCLERLD